jgi:hypothetical protein
VFERTSQIYRLMKHFVLGNTLITPIKQPIKCLA